MCRCPGALRTLETQQEAALRQLREDLLSQRCQYEQDLELRLRDQEAEHQLEVGGGFRTSPAWQGGEALEDFGWDCSMFRCFLKLQ